MGFNYTDGSPATGRSLLGCADVFVVSSHASAGNISSYNMQGNSTGRITGNYDNASASCYSIAALPTNQLFLLRCALFLGCQTGLSNNTYGNLVDAAYAKGASYAMGFKTTVYNGVDDVWENEFWAQAKTGKRIVECIGLACATTTKYNDQKITTADIYYRGDANARLKF